MSTVLRLSIDEYHKMIERGAFQSLRGKNIELLQGVLHNTSPQGPWHSDGVDFLARWSMDNLPVQVAQVRVQEPVTFLDSDSNQSRISSGQNHGVIVNGIPQRMTCCST